MVWCGGGSGNCLVCCVTDVCDTSSAGFRGESRVTGGVKACSSMLPMLTFRKFADVIRNSDQKSGSYQMLSFPCVLLKNRILVIFIDFPLLFNLLYITILSGRDNQKYSYSTVMYRLRLISVGRPSSSTVVGVVRG